MVFINSSAQRGQKARNDPELVSVQKESVKIAKDEKKKTKRKKRIMLITRCSKNEEKLHVESKVR